MKRSIAMVMMTTVLAGVLLNGCQTGDPNAWMAPASHAPKASVSVHGKVIAELEDNDYVLQSSSGKVLLDATKRTAKGLAVGGICEVHGSWMTPDKQGRPRLKVRKVEHGS